MLSDLKKFLKMFKKIRQTFSRILPHLKSKKIMACVKIKKLTREKPYFSTIFIILYDHIKS
jgi:hypothetical protein